MTNRRGLVVLAISTWAFTVCFSLFLISPFTRMIHIWSGAGALAYLFRPYQIVRTPKTRAKDAARS